MKPEKFARLVAAEVVRLQKVEAGMVTLTTDYGTVSLTKNQSIRLFLYSSEVKLGHFLDKTLPQGQRGLEHAVNLYIESLNDHSGSAY